MKSIDLDPYLAVDTTEKGKIQPFSSVNSVIFPDFFPDFFPAQNANTLNPNNEIKPLGQYYPKLSLNFYLYNTKSTTPTPILIYLRIDGTTYKHNSTMRVLPYDWDKQTQRCRITPLQSQMTQLNNQMLNNVINTLSVWFSQMVTYVCNKSTLVDKNLINKELINFLNKMIKRNNRENKKDYANLILALQKQAYKKTEAPQKNIIIESQL